jgi:hypothetical protein
MAVEEELHPANAVTGQQFLINCGSTSPTVPYQYSKRRFWLAQYRSRQTSARDVIELAPDQYTIGYE